MPTRAHVRDRAIFIRVRRDELEMIRHAAEVAHQAPAAWCRTTVIEIAGACDLLDPPASRQDG
jgi:uncharacterized protein (DUF1778 family)